MHRRSVYVEGWVSTELQRVLRAMQVTRLLINSAVSFSLNSKLLFQSMWHGAAFGLLQKRSGYQASGSAAS